MREARPLTRQMKETMQEAEAGRGLLLLKDTYLTENGIESDKEPTEEDIKNQVKLPSHDQVVNQNFKDPICTCKPSQEPRMQQDVQNQTANPGFQSMVCITIAMEDKPTTVDAISHFIIKNWRSSVL